MASTTVYEILDRLWYSATSDADKGSKFERLMAAYLRTDPTFADQFSDVWLWQEWPDRGGKHDTGLAAGAAYRKGDRVDHTLRYGRPERRGTRSEGPRTAYSL